MKYAALILFTAASAIHLYHSWRDDAKRRAYTKPLLLLFLLLFYLACGEPRNGFLIAALLTSWLGDVLLIPKGHGWFTAGGISFMLSHFFFILVYAPQIDPGSVPRLLIAAAAVLYYGISFVIIYKLRPTTPKKMIVPMYFYLLCNSTMNLGALAQLFSVRFPGSLVAYIGAVLFFISDCTLFLVRYYKRDVIFKKHFTVMLTYLAGEFLITLGIVMLTAAS